MDIVISKKLSNVMKTNAIQQILVPMVVHFVESLVTGAITIICLEMEVVIIFNDIGAINQNITTVL